MSCSRRTSVSARDYPEHLNPFNDETDVTLRVKPSYEIRENYEDKSESKNKFWTFGRNKKKRHNSFSLKSTWNGLFGKNKDSSDRRATVSEEYTAARNGKPAPWRISSRDQIEFDEALGTLTRKKKYTFDDSSRCNSNSVANGLPSRIYNENPQETTTSILGNVTPKPPARRFGQVSPRPGDKIPAIIYEDKQRGHDGSGADAEPDPTPVPPKRNNFRASQRMIARNFASSSDFGARDENENENDFSFKRFNQDPSRMSNLSINSCISVGSTASAYARKKRRAPPPPQRTTPTPKENIETPQEPRKTYETSLKTLEDTQENEKQPTQPKISSKEPSPEKTTSETPTNHSTPIKTDEKNQETSNSENMENPSEPRTEVSLNDTFSKTIEIEEIETQKISVSDGFSEKEEIEKIEVQRISRSDSFSVKEEIEKIEKQIKELEARKSDDEDFPARRSIEETRKTFFKEMLGNRVDVKMAELPRVRNDCSVVKIEENSGETVKVIELHISEPIQEKPENFVRSVPVPRRSSSFNFLRHRSIDSMDLTASKISL